MKLLLSVSSVFLAPLMLLAAPAWTYGEYTEASTATTAESGNLMQVAGTLLTVENNTGAWGRDNVGGAEVLTDGVIPYKTVAKSVYSVGNSAVMKIDFAGTANVSSLRFWISTAAISKPRSDISVQKIESVCGVVTTMVSNASYQKDFKHEGFSKTLPTEMRYELADPEGESLCRGAEALLITFGNMQNNGVLMCEVEVIGEMTAVAHCTVTFVDHEGKVLGTLSDVVVGSDVTAQAPEPPEREGYVFMGWSEDLSRIMSDVRVEPVYVAVGEPIWDKDKNGNGYREWNDATRPDHGGEQNLFAQDGVTLEVVRGDDSLEHGDLAAVTDGVISVSGPVYTMGDESSLTFTLPYAQDIGSFELYTHWGDGGRDGLEILALEYKSNAAATQWASLPLEKLSFGLNDPDSFGSYYVRAYCPDLISPLAANAQVFRVRIGKSDNRGTGIAEVRASRFIKPEYAWCGESWVGSADVELPMRDTLLGDNLMRKGDAALALIANVPHDSLYACTNSLAVLTNGVLKADKKTLVDAVYPIGNNALTNAIMECRFDVPKDVSGLRLYTYFHSGARDGIAVRTLYVQRHNEDFFRRIDSVAPWSYGVADDSTSGALVATLSAPAGTYMFSRITALRIEFGALDHDCSTFSEIEVFGRNGRRPLILTIR